MAIPDWITVSPQSGDGNNNIVTITAKENTGNSREGVITFKSGDKTVNVTVQQYRAYRFILNLAPKFADAAYPTEEDATAFNMTVYKNNVESEGLDTSSLEELVSRLRMYNDPHDGVSNIVVNWSPFGGKNYCNYTCEIASSAKPYLDEEVLNPNKQNVLAKLTLNTVDAAGAIGKQYDLAHAAFHQGSPVLEIIIERLSASENRIQIYTLHQYQKDLYNKNWYFKAAAEGSVGTPGTGMACWGGDAPGCLSPQNFETTLVTMAGRLISLAGPLVFSPNGVSRIFLEGTTAVGFPLAPRILKWYKSDNNTITALWAQGSEANKYSPVEAAIDHYSLAYARWTDSATPVVQGPESRLSVEDFYNPE